MSTPNDFDEFVQRSMKMLRLTKNEIINTYWLHIEEVASNGFISFILRGNLCYESDQNKRLDADTGSIWIQSNYYDPVGKLISEEPVRLYLQWQLNLYDIWGGLKVSVKPNDEILTKAAIEQAIQDISLFANLISLRTETSLQWYPARYFKVRVESGRSTSEAQFQAYDDWRCFPFQRQQSERNYKQVNDNFFINDAFPLFEYVRNIRNVELQALLRRAISWHATGNYIGSGLNRFLNYWESVELLAHYFYSRLPRKLTGRLTKSEKKDRVLKILEKEVTRGNCLEIASQLSDVVPSSPSTKNLIQSTIPVITGRDDLNERFFNKDPETSKSLYDIRNDIAHGNHCDHDVKFINTVDAHIYKMSSLSSYVIMQTLQRVGYLEKQLEAQ